MFCLRSKPVEFMIGLLGDRRIDSAAHNETSAVKREGTTRPRGHR